MGGAWVFRNTRMPIEQIHAVLEFAARSLDAPVYHSAFIEIFAFICVHERLSRLT